MKSRMTGISWAADRADDSVGVHTVKLLRGHGAGVDAGQIRALVLPSIE